MGLENTVYTKFAIEKLFNSTKIDGLAQNKECIFAFAYLPIGIA
jgi:hypothetical protein